MSKKFCLSVIEQRIISLTLKCLDCFDNDLILISLDLLQEFFNSAEHYVILNNIVKINIEIDEKAEYLYKLEYSKNEEISRKVGKMLARYWKTDDMIIDFK